jgi:hypothetical protein
MAFVVSKIIGVVLNEAFHDWVFLPVQTIPGWIEFNCANFYNGGSFNK